MRRLTSVVGFFGGLIVVSVVLAGTGATAAAGDRVPSEAPAVTAHQTAVAEDLAELEAAADRLELPELEPGDGSGRDQHSHDGHSHDQSAYLGHDDGEQHLKYDLSDDAVLATGTTVPARFTPRKWPVRTIKYWTDVPESYRWSINAAIKSWNKTGLNMKLKLVKSRAKSNATIRVDKGLSPVSGLATVGYTRGINWIKLSPKSVSGKGAALSLSRTVMAHIVAHEIGHNLGLGHNVKVNCALMQPVLYIGECPLLEKNRPGYYVCEIVDKPAVVPMVRKYGGKKKVNPGKNCTLDALPPELDFTWSGGIEADGPITVTWSPPKKAPAGVMVDILFYDTCKFPVQRDYFDIPESLGWRQARVPIAKGKWVQPANKIFNAGCYGAQAVNKSGAGRKVTSATLTSYVPEPQQPAVGMARRLTWGSGYRISVTIPSGDDMRLMAIDRPQGQCLASWPADAKFNDHETWVSGGTTNVYSDHVNPCFALFTVRMSMRASKPTIVQISSTEPPAAKVTGTVYREGDNEWLIADIDYDWDVQLAPVAVVAAQGSCPSSWPVGVDPEDHGIWNLNDGGHQHPCVSVFARNALGQVNSDPLKVQL